jgi:hypothetical protein
MSLLELGHYPLPHIAVSRCSFIFSISSFSKYLGKHTMCLELCRIQGYREKSCSSETESIERKKNSKYEK